jgi:hypothetical protein
VAPNLKRGGSQSSVSLATARTHLGRVFQKTGVGRQAELVRLIMQTGVRGSHSEGLAEQGPSKNGAFPTWTKKLRPGFVPALICSALPHSEGIWPI